MISHFDIKKYSVDDVKNLEPEKMKELLKLARIGAEIKYELELFHGLCDQEKCGATFSHAECDGAIALRDQLLEIIEEKE